jgi:glutamyl-tRNA reductase
LGLAEAVVLSTCNRLEIYGVTSALPPGERLLEIIAAVKGNAANLNDYQSLDHCLYLHEDEECVAHLFRVASSLDSLVVGETEIVGQVKKAYQLAHACGATGRVLNRLFQKALSVSKAVRTQSGVGRCSTSVGSVALDLAQKVFGEDLRQRTILIVGAGKMGETTLRHLTKHGVQSILVANRSLERALDLVARFDGEAVPFAELTRALVKADIVVTSTGAPHYILSQGDVAAAMAERPDRPLLLIDLAVPRNVDPAVLATSSVYLYNVDQLAELARMNMERRKTEAETCEKLVAAHARQATQSCLGDRASRPALSGIFSPELATPLACLASPPHLQAPLPGSPA